MSQQKLKKAPGKFQALGQLIKGYRVAASLTQKELIERLDFHPKPTTGFLSRVENGSKRPNPKLLNAITNVLNLSRGDSLELLLAADYGMPTEDTLSKANIMMKTLLKILDTLPNEQELIADTATAIFINQVEDLVLLWGEYSLGRSALYEGEMNLAHQKLSQAAKRNFRLSKATNAYLEDAKGEIYYRQGQLNEAHKHFSKAYKDATNINDRYLMGLTTIHLGDIARIRGAWNEALLHYENAREIFFELEDEENMNLARRNATTIYLFRGLLPHTEDKQDVHERVELFTTAKKHMYLKNDQLLSWQLSLAGKWEDSYKLRAQILADAMKRDSKMNKMFAHLFVGDCLLQLHEFDRAEYHFQQAQHFYSPEKAKIEAGYLLLGLARTYQGKGRAFWYKADCLFQDSINANSEVGFKPREALSRYYWG